jgi:hypothetical protein
VSFHLLSHERLSATHATNHSSILFCISEDFAHSSGKLNQPAPVMSAEARMFEQLALMVSPTQSSVSGAAGPATRVKALLVTLSSVVASHDGRAGLERAGV